MLHDWFRDVKSVLLEPTAFYRKMKVKGGYEEPVKFAVTNFVVVGILLLISAFFMGASAATNTLLALIGVAVGGVIGLFLGAAIYHGLFIIFGGRGSYESTVRVMAYASALGLISWIPVAGMIATIYGIYVSGVGFAKVHRMSRNKAIGIVLIPTVVIVLIAALAFSTLGAMAPAVCIQCVE